MGMAIDWVCTSCGEQAHDVCEDGDCGMDLRIVTPVLCAKHGIVWGETDLVWDGEDPKLASAYPCPECGRMSPLWDRATCPACGAKAMVPDPENGTALWD